MPGGFSSSGNQGAYQALGDDLETGRPAPPPHNATPAPPAQIPAQPAAASTTYQTL